MRTIRARKYLMTPDHPQWDEFCDRLEDAAETCSGSIDRPIARQILAAMGADVEASLSYFAEHGGFCDCEVLLNVGSL